MKYSERAQWSSPLNYFLVTGGALVGLGNIFQFPFSVFQYGGLFVLLTILCEFLVALPLLLSELLIGRRGKQNPVGAFELLAFESGRSALWRWAGWIAFMVAFLTLSYYAVSAAFPAEYFLKSVALVYTHSSDTIASSSIPKGYLSARFPGLEIFFLLLLVAVMVVVWRGINRGLEQISRIVVPLYFIIFAGLAVYACMTGNFSAALHQLLSIPPGVPFMAILFAALTFSLFTLNVGMGSMIVYGSYLPYSVPLGRSTFLLVSFDALMSLISYFIIFPLLLHISPGTINGKLTHANVILIFGQIPHGFLIAALFFFAATLAAWIPMIAIAETITVTVIERFNRSRHSTVLIIGSILLVLGSLVVFSHTTLIDEKIIGRIEFNRIFEIMASVVLMPISALLMAIFTGWIIKKFVTETELQFQPLIYRLWLFSVRYVAPLLIVIVFIATLWKIIV